MPGVIVEAAVGLGSNIGDRMVNLINAAGFISRLKRTRIAARSSVYETEPVDVPPEFRNKPFLNAVIIAVTQLTLEEWSAELHAIEDTMLRVRTKQRHIPRTIDIDLLTFGTQTEDRADITIPHPQCVNRRFVCQPFAEIRPNHVIPGETRTMTKILKAMPPVPEVRLFTSNW